MFIFPRAFPKREYLAVENPHGRHGERERQKKNMFSCDRENYVHNDDDDDYRVGFLPTLSRDTHTHTHGDTHTKFWCFSARWASRHGERKMYYLLIGQ